NATKTECPTGTDMRPKSTSCWWRRRMHTIQAQSNVSPLSLSLSHHSRWWSPLNPLSLHFLFFLVTSLHHLKSFYVAFSPLSGSFSLLILSLSFSQSNHSTNRSV